MPSQTILIVEDEAVVALDLKLQLQELGYTIVGIAVSAQQAIDAIGSQVPELILMDVRLQGGVDGIEAAESIRRNHNIPVIFLTAHSDAETVQRAARTAAYGYLTKPYQIKELRAGIEVALTKARMERQLREADRWFAHTLRCVSDGVIVTDVDSRVRFLNPAAEKLTGWLLEEATGVDVGEVVRLRSSASPEMQPAHGALRIAEVLRGSRPLPVAYALVLTRRGGSDQVVDETAGAIEDESGRCIGAVLVLRDASPRVAQEALLRASEARFRGAFDHAPLGMALVSLAGQFIQVNDALCKLLGRSRDELQQADHTALTLESDREHEAQRLHELDAAPQGLAQFEKRYLRGEGAEPVCTLVSVSHLQDEGCISCRLYQVHDLTQQKEAAQRVAELADERLKREASELANASKSEFLSRVSHEMRTPLNAVLGFAQLLQLQQAVLDPEKTQTYAGHIRAAGEHLLALVTDLLDLNRAAQGTLKLALVPVLLSAAVDEVMSFLQGDAQERGISAVATVAPGLAVLADPRRLRQVLLNLLSNAIKYNRLGGVVAIRAERCAPGRVAIVVEDHGIGMTPEQLQRLFQPFDRLGAERTTVPGTGLGLVICRSLVTEMGGSVTVTSTPRSGTAVTVELPAAP